MGRKVNIQQDFIVDKLTNSIKNTISGDSFQTEISVLSKKDLKKITTDDGWSFNWKIEFNNLMKEIYKLTIVNNPDIIQGIMSISIEKNYVFINLLESSPFNIGRNKLYEGVAGNLVAYACKVSFQKGYDGFVAFTAKTKLIEHYEKTLGALHFKNGRMIIPTEPARKLVEMYFKN